MCECLCAFMCVYARVYACMGDHLHGQGSMEENLAACYPSINNLDDDDATANVVISFS